MKQITKKQGGFTLIEVVLVLAIGALIILMALLAFGGASRSRRDTTRANAAGTLTAALEQYAANNNGAYPANQADLDKITTDAMKDPKTGNRPKYSASASADSNIVFSPSANCGTDGKTFTSSSNTGEYAVTYKQESSSTVSCKTNAQ